LEARHYKRLGVTDRNIRLVVIHDMEYPERITAAEDVARYFNTTENAVSAHLCIDNNSVVRCVHDSDVAYAAPGANHDGIQIELAGYSRQNRKDWLDDYGIALLALASNAVAYYCIKYGIPVRQLTNSQLADGISKGIIGHYQASEVFKKSRHSDPGAGFPWDYFIASAQTFVSDMNAKIAV